MNINGAEFSTMSEVAEAAGVTRQTLWRWRADGRVSQGRRYRGRIILYTAAEREEICSFAHRIEESGFAPATTPATGGHT
jgi:DNA-binding transcriptional MerR regulator